MLDFVSRENAVFEAIQAVADAGIEFVVGGYGVSAFQHRYSIDADLLVQAKDLTELAKVLERSGFRQTLAKELHGTYAGVFQRWTKQGPLPVFVDLLADALVVRQTDAEWSFDYVKKHSKKRLIQGIEKQVTALVPEKELLIAMKLHSARLTDVRDAVALFRGTSVEKILVHLKRGNEAKLAQSFEKAAKELEKKQFADSFKGVFATKHFDASAIQELKTLVLTAGRELK